jgi:hypothetical protein
MYATMSKFGKVRHLKEKGVMPTKNDLNISKTGVQYNDMKADFSDTKKIVEIIKYFVDQKDAIIENFLANHKDIKKHKTFHIIDPSRNEEAVYCTLFRTHVNPAKYVIFNKKTKLCICGKHYL